MVIAEELAGVLLVVALGGVGVLGIAVVWLLVRLSRLRRAYASALDPSRREDLFQAVQRHADDLGRLRDDVHAVHARTERLRELVAETVSRVGIVRYDAFEDMGGALSFSAALLDERGNGVVISAINGRSETRCYAKPVHNWTSNHNLSAEEIEAVGSARDDDPGGAVDGRWRRRRVAS